MLLCAIQNVRLQSTLLLRDVLPEGPGLAVPLQILMVVTAVPAVAHRSVESGVSLLGRRFQA